MKKPLPIRANVENLRKQAKSLLAAAQSGEASVLERIAESHPGVRGELALHDAQLVIAREYGFESWDALRSHVETSRAEWEARIALLVRGARGERRDEVLRVLAAHPELADEPALAAVLGDVNRLRFALDEDPTLAANATPYEQWTLLMIASASPLLADPARRTSVLAVIRLLLERGADPNAYMPLPEYPESRIGALYAASAVSRDAEVVRILLGAGADPDDHESLYHSLEYAENLEIPRILIEAGAPISDRNVIHHVLDFEQPAALEMLMELGGDANDVSTTMGMTAIEFAVLRGRSLEVIEILLAYGADPMRPGPKGTTAYARAAKAGRSDLIGAFARHGYWRELSPEEDALMNGRIPNAGLDDDTAKLLPDAAISGNVERVRTLLKAGWPVNARGDEGGSALHWAAWYGNLAMVQAILPFEPDFELRDTSFHAPPLGWADHGSANSPAPKEDYPAVIEAMVRAGAPLTLQPNNADERINEVIRRLKADEDRG